MRIAAHTGIRMDKSEFGKLLTKLRQRDNMTQSDLASVLDVSVSAVSKWENGKNYPDIPVFSALRNLFHLSFDDLYHPARTLQALEQGTLLPVEERIQRPASSDTPQKNRKFFLLSALFLVLLLCANIFSITQWLSLRKNNTPGSATVSEADSDAFSVFTTGAVRDEAIHQDVYEIVLIYRKSSTILPREEWHAEFYRRSEEWWTEHPDTTATCLKITAYLSEGAARKRTDTSYLGYSYYYLKMK